MKKMLKVRETVSDFCLNSNTRPYPTASLKNKNKNKKSSPYPYLNLFSISLYKNRFL